MCSLDGCGNHSPFPILVIGLKVNYWEEVLAFGALALENEIKVKKRIHFAFLGVKIIYF